MKITYSILTTILLIGFGGLANAQPGKNGTVTQQDFENVPQGRAGESTTNYDDYDKYNRDSVRDRYNDRIDNRRYRNDESIDHEDNGPDIDHQTGPYGSSYHPDTDRVEIEYQ